jgi:hypothetical protein
MSRALAIGMAAVVGLLACSCQLGSEQPSGCRVDHSQDCDPGWTCREGVCFRPTTALSPPASDAALDAFEAATMDAQPESEAGSWPDAAIDDASDGAWDGASDAQLESGEDVADVSIELPDDSSGGGGDLDASTQQDTREGG